MSTYIPALDVRKLYDQFNAPMMDIDCGLKCAPHNGGIPVCCDICQAVPAVYRQEWDFLRQNTTLWHPWRGDECAAPEDPAGLLAETPEHMLLLACRGVDYCQREFRALSCRQFPFFPYITADYRFLGLAYEWEFEQTCWAISNLGIVTPAYRQQFIRTYETLFALWDEEFESYALRSSEMRKHFAAQKRRIPLLHRNGGYYLISPASERLRRVPPERLPRLWRFS
ncbi:MAG: hypothetical protein EHM81_07055 [Chloroflexi bacterium]|nr:MAG: hypothetical protein EHM81_07055 [Chloroflexota bacterium]